MQIVNLKKPDQPFPLLDCALCLGNFDGVHIGHRELIKTLRTMNAKRRTRLPLGALLFTKPPSAYLAAQPVPQLTTLEEKLRLLRLAGLQFAILFDFTELKDLAPDDFVRDILINRCHCRMAVCGFNYTYGARGSGTPDRLLSTFGSQPGRELCVVSPVSDGRIAVSSSEIRRLLEVGHPEDATRLLGHPFSLSGRVVSGRQIGAAMGYPTANMTFPEGGLVPAHGVYLVSVSIGRRSYFGISNVGTRPTFDDGDEVNCETFLFDFKGDLYGKELRVSFLRFLRAEKKFASREELEAQIRLDIERAYEYLS